MARISRKEQARRERISRGLRLHYATRRERSARISRGLRRYWQQVRAVAQTEGLSVAQARGVLSGRLLSLAPGMAIPIPPVAADLLRTLEIFVPAPPVREEWEPTPEQGEFAFNLRDVNELERLELPERFRGQRVTADFRLDVFSEGRQRPPDERFLTIEFDAGESEPEFWSNYYEALRTEYESDVETEGLTSTDVGIAVLAMRGA